MRYMPLLPARGSATCNAYAVLQTLPFVSLECKVVVYSENALGNKSHAPPSIGCVWRIVGYVRSGVFSFEYSIV